MCAARGGVSGVWRRTHGRCLLALLACLLACLLARWLAGLLAGLLRVCGPGRLPGTVEQQVPAAVWRDEGQRKAEARRTECRECSQAGEGSGWICGSFANLTGGLWDCVVRRGEGREDGEKVGAKDLLEPKRDEWENETCGKGSRSQDG